MIPNIYLLGFHFLCILFNTLYFHELFRWHRVAVSIGTTTVRLLVDCKQRESINYNRSSTSIDNRGRIQVLKDGIHVSFHHIFDLFNTLLITFQKK